MFLKGSTTNFIIQCSDSKPLNAKAAIIKAMALMVFGSSLKNSHHTPQLKIDNTIS
ncbi:hypothetical protein VCR12J2_70086 [Vibrio coralliirubri]|nr:hypothetical protein VCR12J2_70086 [Vibrio coralliirubri]